MKMYPKYKKSGVEWIGAIPEGWKRIKFKYLVKVKDGTHETPLYVEEKYNTYPFITSKDVKDGKIDFAFVKYISEEDHLSFNIRSNVKKEDIIMPMIGTVGNPVIVETDRPFSFKNMALFKTSLSKNITKYIYYFLLSSFVSEQFNFESRGGVQGFVSQIILKNIHAFQISIYEQKAIANYLDHKTRLIDTLISKKQQQIELLKEQRTAIINRAVTKGLDLNVKLKDSGIEWIGQIPEGWEVKKLFYICYMKGRIGWQGLKQSEFTNEGPYLITGMNFKDGIIKWEEVYHITNERYEEASEIQLKKHDVLMTKDGTIGKLLYIDKLPGKASLNSHLLVLRPLNNEFKPRYLYYALKSEYFLVHIELNKTGTTFFGITQEAMGKFKMLLPPLIEQKLIADYIDQKTQQIDNSISKIKTQISLLQEYRTTLISEVVTGKIDVRGYANSKVTV